MPDDADEKSEQAPSRRRSRGGKAAAERANRCPVLTCRAKPGVACFTTMHGKRVAIIGRVHPERLVSTP